MTTIYVIHDSAGNLLHDVATSANKFGAVRVCLSQAVAAAEAWMLNNLTTGAVYSSYAYGSGYCLRQQINGQSDTYLQSYGGGGAWNPDPAQAINYPNAGAAGNLGNAANNCVAGNAGNAGNAGSLSVTF